MLNCQVKAIKRTATTASQIGRPDIVVGISFDPMYNEFGEVARCTMILEDYFDFLTPEDIRIKGHRIGIETVLADYIYRSQTPEEIATAYPSLSLEQIYATILYYLRNRDAIGKYLDGWFEFGRQAREDVNRHPPEYILRLRELRSPRRGTGAGEGARATG